MSDPTYDKEQISKNPAWCVAFSLSEIMNDGAPVGWSRYIWVAECLLANWEMTAKPDGYAIKPDTELQSHTTE